MQTPIISPISNPDARDERANDLLDAGLNGMRLALIELDGAQAHLDLYFHNSLHLQAIADSINGAEAKPVAQVFVVRGGHRLPAGPGSGQVKCTAVEAKDGDGDGTTDYLRLSIAPIGDYSTYTLELIYDTALIDPFFAELPFKFRPGCFSGDCKPEWLPGRAPSPSPAIDYLAKDYDSFRHTLIAAMMERVPGWQATSEADLDQVLIDLFAASADELSDYQDRVVNEAYLATARKRVSLARHARLVDYHVHQGNQSTTWLALSLAPNTLPFSLSEELVAWAGHPDAPAERIYFASRETQLAAADRATLHPLFSRMKLHTWSDARPALPAGITWADLVPGDDAGLAPDLVLEGLADTSQNRAQRLRDRVRDGTLQQILVQEHLNPLTGQAAGHDPRKRQLLRLIAGDELAAGANAAVTVHDPLTDTWLVRVHWREEDALRQPYAFVTFCHDVRVEDVAAFHGNLLAIHQGLPVVVHYYEPGSELPLDSDGERHRHFERWTLFGESRGSRCNLPLVPLAYQQTAPGGEVPPQSTLIVEVEPPGSAVEGWDEVISLVHSDDSAEDGDHYVVETDELGGSVIRFGDGVNGRSLPAGCIVHCRYQVGGGTSGNVGAEAVNQFRPLSGALQDAIVACWNPFDVSDGRDPEPVANIRRNAPEAFAARQLRAVTLADYVARAEEVPGVSRAVARYAWTGSWRTVRITIDPVGTDILTPELAEAVAAHLQAVRLIGEDLEMRAPRFVPLAIEISLCLRPEFWPEDVRWVLEQEFSSGWTPDGRRGFFHPDAWTFGQALHRSQIAGRVHAVTGVDHVVEIRMRRFNAPPPANAVPELIEVASDEIFLVRNDPDHRELGFVGFNLDGTLQ